MPTDPRPISEGATFHFHERSSNKVYQVTIKPKGDGFVVTFAYGRRGGRLMNSAQTLSPVPFRVAKKLYDKLVKARDPKGPASALKPKKT
jgi:bifunctional non-homologous end joining protein LigD